RSVMPVLPTSHASAGASERPESRPRQLLNLLRQSHQGVNESRLLVVFLNFTNTHLHAPLFVQSKCPGTRTLPTIPLMTSGDPGNRISNRLVSGRMPTSSTIRSSPRSAAWAAAWISVLRCPFQFLTLESRLLLTKRG